MDPFLGEALDEVAGRSSKRWGLLVLALVLGTLIAIRLYTGRSDTADNQQHDEGVAQ